MDPLSAADTIVSLGNRVLNFVASARTNTKKCQEVGLRVQWLQEVAAKIREHPDQLLERRIDHVKEVMGAAEETVKKYCDLKRGLKKVLRIAMAVPIKQQFNDLNASLDCLLSDLTAAMASELRTSLSIVGKHVILLQRDIDNIEGHLLDLSDEVREGKESVKACIEKLEHSLKEDMSGRKAMQRLAEAATKTPHMHLPEQFVNLDSRIKEVRGMLEQGAQAVALVGMGGIGKTTLAKAVYIEMLASGDFKAMGLVTVGQEPDLLQCLKQIWASLVSPDGGPQCNNVQDVKTELLNALQDKKVFLVLDDVWTESSLESLMVTSSNSASRLIITLRNSKLALMAGAQVYHVGLLNDIQSMELFCRWAFGQPNVPSDKYSFSKFVTGMVTECGQLPLALRVIGSMAKGYRTAVEWQSTERKLRQSRSLGREYEDNLLAVLQNSFHDLQEEQKHFFFCLVAFPEGTPVRVSDLVEYWAAQQCLDDTEADEDDRLLDGYAICVQLVDRSLFVLDASLGPLGCFTTDVLCDMHCYMHDMLREMGLQIARERHAVERERLLFPSLDRIGGVTIHAKELSTCNCPSESWPEGFRAPRLWAYLSRGSGSMMLPPGLWLSQQLRALDLSNSHLVSLPQDIKRLANLEVLRLDGCQGLTELDAGLGELKQLTILSLRTCTSLTALPDCFTGIPRLHSVYIGCPGVESLPPSLVVLPNLRKLVLDGCQGLLVLPGNMQMLECAQVLNLAGCELLVHVPDQLESLTCLQEVVFAGCKCIVNIPEGIGALEQLQKLNLKHCKSLTQLPETLGNLTELQTLILEGCESLVQIPDTLGLLTQLHMLDLSGCKRLAQIPESVGSLHQLEVLNLRFCASLGHLPEGVGSLIELQVLDLRCCKKLTHIPDSVGGLSKLEELLLPGCNSLRQLPESVGQLSKLQVLNLNLCMNLESIPKSLGSLHKLNNLNLNFCASLTHLPECMGSLSQLKKLYILNCDSLEGVPSGLEQLEGLRIWR